MKLAWLGVGIGVAVLSSQSAGVSAARAALGGDAALGGVSSFQVSGTLTRTIAGHSSRSDIVISCVPPDRFIQVATRVQEGPRSFTITDYDGVNAGQPIRDTEAPDAPFPVYVTGPPPSDPQAAARVAQARLQHAQRMMAELLVPLFVDPGPAYSIAWRDAAAQNVVEGTGPDGFAWRLSFDPATHLPSRLEWQDKPIVMVSQSATIAVGRNGGVRSSMPTPSLPANPTAGLPEVIWRIDWSDYKSADGVTWPHRAREYFGDQLWLEWRLGRFEMNLPLKDDLFKIR